MRSKLLHGLDVSHGLRGTLYWARGLGGSGGRELREPLREDRRELPSSEHRRQSRRIHQRGRLRHPLPYQCVV